LRSFPMAFGAGTSKGALMNNLNKLPPGWHVLKLTKCLARPVISTVEAYRSPEK
jgi:hypothetical protein